MINQVYGHTSVDPDGTMVALRSRSTNDPTLAVFSWSRYLLLYSLPYFFFRFRSEVRVVFIFPLPNTKLMLRSVFIVIFIVQRPLKQKFF